MRLPMPAHAGGKVPGSMRVSALRAPAAHPRHSVVARMDARRRAAEDSPSHHSPAGESSSYGTSFGERDVLDRTPARETREVVGQGSAARKLDGVGDEDDIAAGGVVVSRESKVRGREVQRSLETEGAATVDGVVSGRAAGRDRPILEEEHRLHGSARGGRERSRGTVDVDAPICVARGRGVVERDAGAVYRGSASASSVYLEAASVDDVDAGSERHVGAASDLYAITVDAGPESRRAAGDTRWRVAPTLTVGVVASS